MAQDKGAKEWQRKTRRIIEGRSTWTVLIWGLE